MQNHKFPTKQELLQKPLYAVRAMDIQTPEQEALVQEVVNIKMGKQGIDPEMINRRDAIAADIKTVEEEKKWQEIIDRRNDALRAKQQVILPNTEAILEAKIETIEAEQKELNQIIHSGEAVLSDGTSFIPPTLTTDSNITIDVKPEVAKFCNFCDSKGFKHKLNCTRVK